jgi:hypothetical protein
VLNGFPLRLVVPDIYGTYWVKHLNEITVVDDVFDGFWMKSAYRIPDNACACVPAGTAPKATIPINRLGVRSFITNVKDGAKLKAGGDTLLKGIASTAAMASPKSRCRPTAARPGPTRRSVRTSANDSFREWRLR